MRKHPLYETLKAGDILVADNGFTCIPPGTPKKVQSDDGGLFVRCCDGNHYLAGQTPEMEPEGEVSGFTHLVGDAANMRWVLTGFYLGHGMKIAVCDEIEEFGDVIEGWPDWLTMIGSLSIYYLPKLRYEEAS
jgi:hypothetical protein